MVCPITFFVPTMISFTLLDSPEDLGVQFIEIFIKKQDNVALILNALEVCLSPGYMISFCLYTWCALI